MPQRILEKRMDILEQTVASLADMPTRMDELSSQFLQLRQDVRSDISALELRVDRVSGEVGELRGEVGGLRSELYAVRDELRADMASMHTELAGAILANGVEMRALHEDLVTRISLLGESLSARPDTPERPGR